MEQLDWEPSVAQDTNSYTRRHPRFVVIYDFSYFSLKNWAHSI